MCRAGRASRCCVYTSRLSLYTSPLFFVRRQGDRRAGRLNAIILEDAMRAEAQKLSDEIKEAFALLRRSL
jgi:hypothetical protein